MLLRSTIMTGTRGSNDGNLRVLTWIFNAKNETTVQQSRYQNTSKTNHLQLAHRHTKKLILSMIMALRMWLLLGGWWLHNGISSPKYIQKEMEFKHGRTPPNRKSQTIFATLNTPKFFIISIPTILKAYWLPWRIISVIITPMTPGNNHEVRQWHTTISFWSNNK